MNQSIRTSVGISTIVVFCQRRRHLIAIAEELDLSHSPPKKEICKWKRNVLEDSLPFLALQITEAKYVCRKCGRAAADKKLLCKPTKLAPLLADVDGSE